MEVDVLTYTGVVEQYLKEKPLSEATAKTYRSVVRKFTSDTQIEMLSDTRFSNLLDWRLDVISRSSDITWNNYLRHMRALYAFAIKRHWVPPTNIFKELHWGKYKSNKIKTIRHDQLDSIIEYLESDECVFQPNWFWLTVVRAYFFTGIRRSQLVHLKWEDIDLVNSMIYLDARGEKTDLFRELPLRPDLVNYLLEYKKMVLLKNPDAHADNLQLFNITLFNSKFYGDEMSIGQVSGFFRRLSRKLGFPVSSHRFRHTMADEMARKTGQIKLVQEILGHENIKTTIDFYLHPNQEQLKMAFGELKKI